MERAGVPLLLLAAHASDDVRLPGEEGTKPAVTCAPFPDALSAFVWRNWPVVDAGRMAQEQFRGHCRMSPGAAVSK